MQCRAKCTLVSAMCMTVVAILAAAGQCQVVGRTAPVVLSVAPSNTCRASTAKACTPVAYHQNTGRVVPTVLPACYDCPALAGLVPLPASGDAVYHGAQPVGTRVTRTMVAPLLKPVAMPARVPVTRAPRVRVLRPVLPLVPPAPPGGYVVGRGLIGQPKLYLPGQPIRNFLRYLTP